MLQRRCEYFVANRRAALGRLWTLALFSLEAVAVVVVAVVVVAVDVVELLIQRSGIASRRARCLFAERRCAFSR